MFMPISGSMCLYAFLLSKSNESKYRIYDFLFVRKSERVCVCFAYNKHTFAHTNEALTIRVKDVVGFRVKYAIQSLIIPM